MSQLKGVTGLFASVFSSAGIIQFSLCLIAIKYLSVSLAFSVFFSFLVNFFYAGSVKIEAALE